jgi:hypothetical protein
VKARTTDEKTTTLMVEVEVQARSKFGQDKSIY